MSSLVKEIISEKPFDFRKELETFLGDAKVFDGYYKVELQHGTPPESIEAQVCKRAEYKSVTRNKVGEDPVEKLMIPELSEISAIVTAPPVIPYVIDEFMPQELWEVVKSDDPSKAPEFNELKCVEISIQSKNAFLEGSERKSGEIFRIDLTKSKPVIYRREPVSEKEPQKHDALGYEDKVLTALLDFVQPFPRFTYVKVPDSELERVTRIVSNCRKMQLQNI